MTRASTYHLHGSVVAEGHLHTLIEVFHCSVVDAGRNDIAVESPVTLCFDGNACVLCEIMKFDLTKGEMLYFEVFN